MCGSQNDTILKQQWCWWLAGLLQRCLAMNAVLSCAQGCFAQLTSPLQQQRTVMCEGWYTSGRGTPELDLLYAD